MTKRLAAAGLFAAVWILYLPGYMGCHDSMWSIPTAVSLLDHGDATLDEYEPLVAWRGGALTRLVGGHRYSIYPLGTPIMAIPGVVLLRPIASIVERHAPALWARLRDIQARRGCEPDGGEPVVALQTWTEHLIASAYVAATAVIVFALAADVLTIGWALAAAAVFAFGTAAWSTASRALWQHGPSMLLLAAALLVQVRGGRALWIGALLAFAYVVRPTNAIPFAAAAAWVAVERRRELLPFAVAAAAVGALFVAANLRIDGSWVPPYYRPGFYAPNHFVLEALAGDLVSPSRGLFVFSPVLLLALAGFTLKASGRRLTTLDLSLAACIVSHWVAIASSNASWWGGHSYGPRFFADMLPYLMWFVIAALASPAARSTRPSALPTISLSASPTADSAAASRTPSAGRWSRASSVRTPSQSPVTSLTASPAMTAPRRSVAIAFVALAVASVAVHAQGVLDPATVAWNAYPVNIDADPSRVWDWRRPQFLAGLTFMPEPRRIDFASVRCSAPPAQPRGPLVAAVHGSSATVRWPAAPKSDVVVYLVEIGRTAGAGDLPARVAYDLDQPSVTIRRLAPGSYFVRVVARNGCGDSAPSPEIAIAIR